VTNHYIKDAAAIYRASFSIIREEADFGNASPALTRIIVRMIHACGMTDLPADVASSEEAAERGRIALLAGAPILCDSTMLAAGITRTRLPRENAVLCTLNHPDVPTLAEKFGTTRSAAAVALWQEHLPGALVAIGNAPTALFHLLDLLMNGAPHPALVLGLPVGFVGAAESKLALARNTLGIPYITIYGRRGGSAMASAAINALASEDE
jgi:precorrin-8X/cobalt-precorrin-8 methylmutase